MGRMKKMDNGIGEFVKQLELKDMRKSLLKMQELIIHKGLQKKSDEEIAGAFQIDSVDQFDLSRVNLIKVLGLGNTKYYTNKDNLIPNLLINEQEEGMELYALLTLNYFLRASGYVEATWDNSISIPLFYNKMKNIFGFNEEIQKNIFGKAIQFLINNRLLLRSADQPQDDVPGIGLNNVNDIEFVYVSGAAVTLWNELGKSSALFQLYLDDIWLDEDSSYFEENGNDIEHCLEYLTYLIDVEQKIFNLAANRGKRAKDDYLRAFGEKAICRQLLQGLISSLVVITASDDNKATARITKAKSTLKEANDVLRRLTTIENVGGKSNG
jgi:hypothetical protein